MKVDAFADLFGTRQKVNRNTLAFATVDIANWEQAVHLAYRSTSIVVKLPLLREKNPLNPTNTQQSQAGRVT